MADKAGYNEKLLSEILKALPDLEGTGFSQADLDALDRVLGSEPQDREATKEKDPVVKIGMWKFTVEQDSYDAWKEQLQIQIGAKSKHRCTDEIMSRLGFPEREPEYKVTPIEPSPPPQDEEESVPIGDILPHPLNPREGDVGAITQSLQALGQYRPIVVNKRTGHCLSGNHTLQAMALLGWEKVGVTWVDVDTEEEIKILIVDNRTSDLATYDTFDLHKLLTQSANLAGTGFTKEEVAEILAGGKATPRYSPVGRTNIKVGDYSRRVHNEDLNSWSNAVYRWEDVVELLQLPLSSCHIEERE
jgi:hypothetical protein